MKAKEIRELIQTKREEMRGYLKAKETEKADAAMEELRSLKKQLEMEEEIEEEDREELRKQGEKREAKTGVDEMRTAVKFALKGGNSLSEEERAAVNIENNAAILPEQFVNDLQILREGFPSLKQYCHIIKASSNHGKMPFAEIGGKKLKKYKSGTKLTGEAASTQEIQYLIENYGSLVPIANDLLEDEAINIINDVIKPDFAEASINTENEEIIKILKENATDKSAGAADYKAVKKAIDGVLPTLKGKIITITNLSGYVYLKGQRDKNDRDMELVKNINGTDYFESKPLITLSDEDLPGEEGKQIFYVVNLYALVKFFERKGYTVSTDKSIFFESDEVALKVQERFDCEKLDIRACFKIEF